MISLLLSKKILTMPTYQYNASQGYSLGRCESLCPPKLSVYSVAASRYHASMSAINIQHGRALKALHTFACKATAQHYLAIDDLQQLPSLFNYLQRQASHLDPPIILGDGSNSIFMGQIQPLIIHNRLMGVHIAAEDKDSLLLEVAAGENWHQLVSYCVKHGYWGLENLALIPGSAGAAPVQNIGAYGAELSHCLQAVTVFDLQSGKLQKLNASDCKLGYRDSIFKHPSMRGRYLISSIQLKLYKQPQLNLTYAPLADYLLQQDIKSPTLQDVYQAVINIRQAKLPDPKQLANAGSFFKNPIVSRSKLEQLKCQHPHIPHFKLAATDQLKLSAAWMLEQCNFKAKRIGNLGCYKHQALIMVHYGDANSAELRSFIKQLQSAVAEKFTVELSPEVNLYYGN